MLQSPAPRILLARRRPRCCGGAGPQPSAPTRRPSEARPAGAPCCSEAARRGHPRRERRGDPRGDPSARRPPASLRRRSASPGAALLHARLPFPPGSRLVFIDPDVAFTSWMKGAGSARETPPRRRGCGTAACPRLRRAPSWGGSAVPRSPAARHPDLRGHPAQGGCLRPRLLRVYFDKIRSCPFLGASSAQHSGESRKLPPKKSWSNGKALKS